MKTNCTRIPGFGTVVLPIVGLGTDGYTIGTGMMPSELNFGRIVSIPYKSEEYYILGYILRGDKSISQLLGKFIRMLKEVADQ